jgi:flavodoxin
MKVLIVYDSVSPSKMTKSVAETIGETLREKGIEADTRHYEEVEKSVILNYDCVIVGAPTMAFQMSKGMAQLLNDLKGMDFKGKRAAGFDTQMQTMMSGNAAKGIEKRLEDLGFAIFKPHLVVYVERKTKDTWQFKDGEVEKIKNWAQEASSALTG